MTDCTMLDSRGNESTETKSCCEETVPGNAFVENENSLLKGLSDSIIESCTLLNL